MTTLALVQPILHNPAEPDLLVRLLMVGDRDLPASVPGEVRRYANGVSRLVRGVGTRRGVNLTAGALPADLVVLTRWLGQPVLYRDGLGTRLWVVYLDATPSPVVGGRRSMVPLSFTEVTYREVV